MHRVTLMAPPEQHEIGENYEVSLNDRLHFLLSEIRKDTARVYKTYIGDYAVFMTTSKDLHLNFGLMGDVVLDLLWQFLSEQFEKEEAILLSFESRPGERSTDSFLIVQTGFEDRLDAYIFSPAR